MPTTNTAAKYLEQPAVAAVIRLLMRPEGVTVPQIARYRRIRLHSARSVISRIESVGRLRLKRAKADPSHRLRYHAPRSAKTAS